MTTAVFEDPQQAEALPRSVTVSRLVIIKSRLADLWPPTMIAFGLALTFLWTGGLIWLLLSILHLII